MRSFLNACGFWEPLRLIIEGPRSAGGEARPWPLPQPFAVVGRDPRSDVVLDDLKVSRRHVYIQAVAGQVFWIDLESRSGTCDETGTRKWGWLAPGGGLLQIGPFVIRRDGGDTGPPGRESPRESPMAVRSFGREPLPEVALEFLNGPSQETVWPMNRVMSLVGSAQGCKFRLTDPSVSAFHASLLRTPTGLWVVDLRGGRSISINAEPVRFGSLADGDVLGIGRYRMRIRCQGLRAVDPEPSGESSAGWPSQRSLGALARRPGAGAVPALSPFGGSMMPMPPPPIPVVASAAGVELVAADSGLPGRLHPEVTDSVLVPLVNQFSMMQQQMFDQFQQAMGMLVQMFSSMHREQMDVIREELDRLHDLTRELQELKEELAKAPGRQSAAPTPSPASAGPAATAAPTARPAAGSPSAGITMPPPRPSADVSDPRRPNGPVAASSPSPDPARPTASPSPPPPSPPAGPRPDQRPPGLSVPGMVGGPEIAAAPQDAVAWIHQRIAAIQQERETRWQKIVKLLPGMS